MASLLILGCLALFVRQPGYMDAYYYYHVAANLASGKGLVESFIWNYLSLPASILHPSNLYWMPLTSLVAAPFMVALGTTFRAAQIPFVLLGATAPALAYYLGHDIFEDRRYALGMAALTLFSGFYFVYWTAIDSFGLFSLLANLALIVTYKLARRVRAAQEWGKPVGSVAMRLAVLFGALTALAYLARADAPLLLLTLPVVMLLATPKGRLRTATRYTVVALCGFIVVVAPWLARNWIEVGALLPGGSLKTLFLTEYNDLFSYARELSPQAFVAWGWDQILWSRAQALARNPLVLFGIEYYVLPFAAVGIWRLRRRVEYWPVFVYAVLLYLVMSLVFSFVSGRGSMLHSSVVLLPWLAGAAIHGLDGCVQWVGRRLRHWDVPRAQRNLTAVMVVFALGMSVFLFLQDLGGRDTRYEHYNELARWFAANATQGVAVMIVDPPGFFYSSGQPGIVVPSDGVEPAIEAAERYGARYLVLEKLHARAYQPLYDGVMTDRRLAPAATIGETKIYAIASFRGFRARLP